MDPSEGEPSSFVEIYLAYFEEAKRLHREELGTELEMYKPTEPECLAHAFRAILGNDETGADFISALAHHLAWSQCLGNANHRTLVLFLYDFLDHSGVSFPTTHKDNPEAKAMKRKIESWIIDSQSLIRRRGEPGYAQRRLEPEHKKITRKWIAGTFQSQSDSLMIIGPHSLLTFLSGTSSSSVRGE